MITLYTLEHCSSCKILKAHLLSQGINFVERDLKTRDALAELRVEGCFSTIAPILKVDDRFFTYEDLFDNEELKKEIVQILSSGQ